MATNPDLPKKSKKVPQEAVTNQLIENNMALQAKIADLVLSINNLSKRMTTMLDLFDEAAKHIKAGTDEPLMRKLEVLLEQNKNIARGLVLLEKYVREKAAAPTFTPPRPLTESENF